MAIEVNYRQAARLFLSHLQENNMTDRRLKSYKQTLGGSFKRFIGSELRVYPLSLDKIRERYPQTRQYSFAYSAQKFLSFIKSNPNLLKESFGQAIAELLEHLTELSTITKRGIKKHLFKIISLDIDDLAVSQIPEKVIRDCMKESSWGKLIRGKRFLKFLIHANMLDSKHLPVYTSKIIKFSEHEGDSSVDRLEVKQACRLYIKHLIQETRLRDGAVRSNYYHILAFAQFIGNKKKINLISRDDIRCYLNHLELKRGYSQESKTAVLTTIRSFFTLFAAQGLVKANTTANIKIKKVKKIDTTALSEEELTAIFSAAYLKYQPYDGIIPTDSRATLARWLAARDWAIICLLICTGLRRKEIASLKTDSIDFRQRVIRIAGKGDNTYQVRERMIPVTEPIALSAVEIYLSLRPQSIFDHLFLSIHLEPLTTCGFTKVVTNMKQKLFPQKCLTITQIRKSFVSLCAEKGIDPLILKQIMGHNSLATTMKYYLTVQEQQLREVWEKNNPLLYFSKKEFEEWTI